MLWFTFILISVVGEVIETIIDKLAVVDNEKNINPIIASFYRNLAFFSFIVIGAITGIFGEFQLFFAPPLILLGTIWVLSSLSYDYLLKNAEITWFGSLIYLFSISTILIDVIFFRETFNFLQIVGIISLLIGAYLLSKKKNSLSKISKKTWLILFLKFTIYVLAYSIFKWYNNSINLNEISFYISVWAITIPTFVILILIKKKYNLLVSTAKKNKFLAKTILAKFFDFISSIFFLKAIALSNISLANAAHAIFPLVLLGCSYFLQRNNFNLKEDFEKSSLNRKLFSISCIVFGVILILI